MYNSSGITRQFYMNDPDDGSYPEKSNFWINENLARIAAMVDSIYHAVNVMDLSGTSIYINQAFTDLFGYNIRELNEIGGARLLWADATSHDQAIKTALSGVGWQGEVVLKKRDDEAILMFVQLDAIKDHSDKQIGLVETYSEIVTGTRDLAERDQDNMRYRQMFQRNRAVKLIVDPQTGEIVDANPAAATFYGYSLRTLKSKNFIDLAYSNQGRLKDTLNDALQGKIYYFQLQQTRENGDVRDVEVYASPISIGHRELVYALIHDITDRKHTENTLRRRFEMERLVASVSAGFISLPHESYNQQINGALERIGTFMEADHCFLFMLNSGGSIVEHTNEWFREGISQRKYIGLDLQAYPWLLERLRKGTPVYFDRADKIPTEARSERNFAHVNRLNTILMIPLFMNERLNGVFGTSSAGVISNYTAEDTKLLGIMGEMLANIYERQQTEAALDESEQRYYNLFNNIPLGIFRVDANANLVDANDMMAELFRYPDRQTLLQDRTIERFMTPEDLDKIVALFEQNKPFVKAVNLRRYDGTTFWGELTARIVTYKKTGKTSYEGAIQDITQRTIYENQMKRQMDELVILNAVAGIGAEATNEDDLLSQAALQIGKMLHPYRCTVMICSPERSLLHGYSTEEIDGKVRVKPAEAQMGIGVIGLVAQDGMPRRIPNISQSSDYFEVLPETQSEICIALKAEGKILGIINLESSEPDKFTDEDLNLITVISRQIATALTKVRFLHADSLRRLLAELLSKATASLVSSQDTKEVLGNILRYINQIIPSDLTMAIMLEGNRMEVVAIQGDPELEKFHRSTIMQEGNPYARMLRSSHAQIITNLAVEGIEESFVNGSREGSWMGVPLTIRGRIEGFLTLYNRQPAIYGKSDLDLAMAFANHAAAALENARLFEQTKLRAQEMQSVIEASSALRKAETAASMYPILVDQIRNVVKADAICLFLHENENIELMSSIGLPQHIHGIKRQLTEENDPFLEVIKNTQPLTFDIDKAHSSYSESSILWTLIGSMQQCSIIPMMSINQVIGLVFVAYADKNFEIPTNDWRTLLTVIEIAGNALRRALVMETLENRVIERTRHLSTMYDVSEIASQSQDMSVILNGSLDKLLEVIDSKGGAIYLYDENRSVFTLAAQRRFSETHLKEIEEIPLQGDNWDWTGIKTNPESMAISDMRFNLNVPSGLRTIGAIAFIGVPITAKGRLFGLICLMGDTIRYYSSEDIGFIAAIADQIGNAIESARLRKQAEEIAVMEERQRLARELHDSVTQSLYSITLLANAAHKQSANQKWDRADLYIKELGESAQQALKEMRLLIYELRPSALEHEGLFEAIRQRLESVERRAGIHTQYHFDLTVDLPRQLEEGFYRVAIEALNNILKHASATLVSVNLWIEQDQLILEIQDNGVGFNPDAPETQWGIGLKSMHERIDKLGGKLTITSSPGNGTTVLASVSIKHRIGV